MKSLYTLSEKFVSTSDIFYRYFFTHFNERDNNKFLVNCTTFDICLVGYLI